VSAIIQTNSQLLNSQTEPSRPESNNENPSK
jgi:hypothetical protein